MNFIELKKSLTDFPRKSCAELYRIAWVRAVPTLFIIMYWGNLLPWYSAMTFSALALTAAGALIAELTHANVQERMVRSDNPFRLLQFVHDRFVEKIELLKQLPLADSEKATLYRTTYEHWLNSSEAIEAMILSTSRESNRMPGMFYVVMHTETSLMFICNTVDCNGAGESNDECRCS